MPINNDPNDDVVKWAEGLNKMAAPPSSTTAKSPARKTQQQAYKDFRRELENRGVRINSGYRTRAQQESLYRRLPKGQAARPGTSEHEFWKAVDLPPNVKQNVVEEAAKAAGVKLKPRNVHKGTGWHNHQGFMVDDGQPNTPVAENAPTIDFDAIMAEADKLVGGDQSPVTPSPTNPITQTVQPPQGQSPFAAKELIPQIPPPSAPASPLPRTSSGYIDPTLNVPRSAVPPPMATPPPVTPRTATPVTDMVREIVTGVPAKPATQQTAADPVEAAYQNWLKRNNFTETPANRRSMREAFNIEQQTPPEQTALPTQTQTRQVQQQGATPQRTRTQDGGYVTRERGIGSPTTDTSRAGYTYVAPKGTKEFGTKQLRDALLATGELTPAQVDRYIASRKAAGTPNLTGKFNPNVEISVPYSVIAEAKGTLSDGDVIDQGLADVRASREMQTDIAMEQSQARSQMPSGVNAPRAAQISETDAKAQLEAQYRQDEIDKRTPTTLKGAFNLLMQNPISRAIDAYKGITGTLDPQADINEAVQSRLNEAVQKDGGFAKVIERQKQFEGMPALGRVAPSVTQLFKGLFVDSVTPWLEAGGLVSGMTQRYILNQPVEAKDTAGMRIAAAMKDTFEKGLPDAGLALGGGDIDRGIGQAVGTIFGAGIVGRLAKGTASLATAGGRYGSAYGVAAVSSEAYDRARKSGATEDQANLAAVLSAPFGLVEGLSERYLLGKLETIQTLDKATDGAFSKQMWGRIKDIGETAIKNGTTEWIFEEIPQAIGSEVTAQIAYEQNRRSFEKFLKDIDEAVVQSAIAFPIGAIVGGGTAVYGQAVEGRVEDDGSPAAPPRKRVEAVYDKPVMGMTEEAPRRPATVEGANRRIKELETEIQEERRRGDTNPLTELGSKQAWSKARPRIEADPDQTVISMDINRMKEANDTTSHSLVDDKVLKHLGKVTREVLEANGIDTRNAFTPSGDELYIAVPKGKDAAKIRDEIEKAFGTVEITAAKDFTNSRTGESFKKGDVIPVTISGDVGLTVEEAERGLSKRKQASKDANPVRRGGQTNVEATIVLAANEAASERSGSSPLRMAAPKADTSDIGFFSQVERVIEAKMPNRASAEQIKGLLSPNNGVKKEELEWLDIDTFLADNPNPTKEQVLAYVRANNADVQEVVKGVNSFVVTYGEDVVEDGFATLDAANQRAKELEKETGIDHWGEKGEAKTKFSQYTLPGGEDYRELLLTMPAKDTITEHRVKAPQGWGDTDGGNIAIERRGDTGADYRSSHWSEPNVLAHVRFDTRDDGKTLHIAEIQSDWHQAGRKKGYGSASHPYSVVPDVEGFYVRDQENPNWDSGNFPTRERAEAFIRERASFTHKGVPDAPFKTSWPMLAFKRVLRYAAENGYERVTFDTGETNAERYDLSKQVERINVEATNTDGVYFVDISPIDGDIIYLEIEDGKVRSSATGPSGADEMGLTGKPLDDVIGKEMAQKILDVPQGELAEFEGDDLKVGGGGMRAFYDTILPNEINKYVKKWGGRVEKGEVSDKLDGYRAVDKQGRTVIALTTREAVERWLQKAPIDFPTVNLTDITIEPVQDKYSVHSLTITPAMREAVLQGQPLFKKADPADVDYLSDTLRKAHIQDVIENAEATFTDGNLEMNEEATELTRRLITAMRPTESGNAFWGITLSRQWLRDLSNTAKKWADKYVKDLGYTEEQVENLRTLGKQFEELAKKGEHGILYVFDEALPEETHHKMVLDAGGISNKAIKLLKKNPLWKTNEKFTIEYPGINERERNKAMELAAKLETGQHGYWNKVTAKDKRDFLRIVADDIIERNTDADGNLTLDPVAYERITKYGDTKTGNTGRTEGDQTQGTRENVSDGDDTQASEGTRDKGDRRTAADGDDRGPSVSSGKKEKGQQVAAFSRILGQEYFYDPQSHSETERLASQLLSDKGTEAALNEALYGKPSAEGMRVLQWELERLNGLTTAAVNRGDDEAANAYANQAADLASKIIQRQVATGQEVEINKRLLPLSPEAALLTAQRLVAYAKGPDVQLSGDQTQAIIKLAEELKTERGRTAEAEEEVAKLKRRIKALETERPERKRSTPQKKMLEEYRRKKPQLLAELRDLFPNASVFSGDSEALKASSDTPLRMAAPRDAAEIDADTIAKLAEYAAGEILEGKAYQTLIQELEAITNADMDTVREIHAMAVGNLRRASRELSDEDRDRIKRRQEHYREANKILNASSRPAPMNREIEMSNVTRRAMQDDRYKDDEPLIEAIERLTGPYPRNINDTINDLREIYPEMSMGDLEDLARKARAIVTRLKQEMADERDALKGIEKEQRAKLNEARIAKQKATVKLNKFLNNLAEDPNWVKRMNDDFRAKFVLNYGTQLFNATQALAVSTLAETLMDMFEIGLKTLGVRVGNTPDINAKDILLPFAYIAGNYRQMAEGALSEFPDQFYQIHSGLLGDIEIEQLQTAERQSNIASRLIHKWFDKNQVLNDKLARITGAKLQEMHFRNAIIAATFDQIIRRKSNGNTTLEEALETGSIRNFITEEEAQFAADKAMRITFAALMDDKTGKALKRAYDKLDHYLPIFLNPVVYARFTYTTTKLMVLNPITFGILNSSKLGGKGYTTRDLAAGTLAWGGIATAWALMSAFGDDDDEWHTLKFGDTTVDIRRWYPASTFFYMAHLLRQGVSGKPMFKGNTTGAMVQELLEGFASLETDYFTYGAGMEVVQNLGGYAAGSKDASDVGASAARLAGNSLAGYARFFKPMRDVLAQFDKEEAKLRFYDDSAQDKFIKEIARSVPLIARAYNAEPSVDAQGNEILQPFPAGRLVGINVVHPTYLRPKQTPATAWATKYFRFEGGGDTMTAEQRKAASIRRSLKNAIRRGEMVDVENRLKEIKDKKMLSDASLRRLRDELKMSELEAAVKYYFGPGDAKDVEKLRRVWSVADEAEKQALRKILREKKNRTREFNQEFGL